MTVIPTQVVGADDEIMDFSTRRRSLKFRIDEDIFEAVPDIAAELAWEYAAKVEVLSTNEATVEQQKDAVYSLFRMVLFPESAERFIKRLGDQRNPIGQQKVADITRWLFEEYGLRPTQSDSVS